MMMQPDISCTLQSVGFITILYFVAKITYKIFHHLRVYTFPTYPDFSKYGKWSVITGSTGGIGKALALELASRGQNIILLARNEEKLQKVAKEISSLHGVEVKYLSIDFTDDESIYEKIEDFLEGFDIGVLVNNVGITLPFSKYLDVPNLSNCLRDIVKVNMISVLKMHQIVLEGMVERKRGLIINLSSAAVENKIFPVYGATKAFVDYFSQAISYEYEDKGITIQSCKPCAVNTPMAKDLTDPSKVEADYYAASLLATVDKERSTHGCWKHSFMAGMLKVYPTKLLLLSVPKMKPVRGGPKNKEQ